MTENHGYNTPAEGTTDWHVPLNENFELLDTDAPLIDTEANLSQYTPKTDALFIASDTGERYVGDGSSWVGLPAPGTATTQDTTSTGSILGIVSSTPTHVAKKDGEDSVLIDAATGSELARGTGADVLREVESVLSDGDHIHFSPGVYNTDSVHNFEGYSNITWTSDAVIRWNHPNTTYRRDTMLRFKNHTGLTFLGGVYDGYHQHNANCDDFGCSGTVMFVWIDDTEIGHVWFINGNRWNCNIRNPVNTRFHHNYIANTNERGIYCKAGQNFEVDHNVYANIARGAFRCNDSPDYGAAQDYHLHDNTYFMGPDHPFLYLVEKGSNGFLFERETVVNFDSYGVVRMRLLSDDGVEVSNMTFRDCYYHGHGGEFDMIGDGVDLSSFVWDNVTVENMTVNENSIQNGVDII